MEKPNPEQQPQTISIKLRVDAMTDTIIKDKERGLNVLLVAVPLSTPKLVALGFLWSVLDNLTTFYKHVEAQAEAKKGGLIKASLSDIAGLGRKLTGG